VSQQAEHHSGLVGRVRRLWRSGGGLSAQAEQLVARHWSKMATEGAQVTSWTESPLVVTNINRLVSGDVGTGWLKHACETYLLKDGRGVERGLSIGCGTGALERQARTMGACQVMDAYDLAPGAVEEARRQAEQEGIDGISYEVRNLEALDLPRHHYDVVFASSSIHHIRSLEHLFDQIRRTLRPGGVFVMLEYVGPSQFQFTPKAVRIINEILAVLPPRFRRMASRPGEEKTEFRVSPIEYMNATDPSEAVRSAEILPLLQRRFSILEKRDFGGTINHMLLQDIIQNFDDGTPEGEGMLALLLYFEMLLIEERVLDSDFCFVVAA
jgi:ubiquinone/menaquinone biosynthesis C-methylase UbiE